jgi:UDP-N-acetylglucosamine 4,6-dehydratase
MMDVEGRTILITGGTGSFGRAMVSALLKELGPKKVIVYSRDELKQYDMQQEIHDARVRFFIGDVRDRDRLRLACTGVDIVIHAAALKQVPAAEYNPFEAIKTNVLGGQNVIEAALQCGVGRVIALSTDKAANPINLYGATKLCSDKLFVASNAYAGGAGPRMSVVRYGNVVGSRGSVVPAFIRMREKGRLTITDPRMTRFWITLDQGVRFVLASIGRMHGGELYVPKIPSTDIVTLAEAIAPGVERVVVGVRPGEKLHELMIGVDDARRTRDMGSYYVVQPEFPWWSDAAVAEGKAVPDGFSYSSDGNSERLGVDQVRELLVNLGLLQ